MVAVEVGQTLAGKLQVEGVLGQGGMGVVLVARHTILNERVAVKLLRPQDPGAPPVPHDPTHVERLHREARAAARLKGIHVSRVMDVGTLDDGSPYIVMEYIEGATLAATVRERGALPVEEAVDYALQTCEGLAEAHAAGIVHRDLKPSNLMLTRAVDGSPLVKILDFGIARASDGHQPTLTGSSVMLGSPSYMSPEQIRDAHDVDERTDIWSLGVTLYELLTHRLPFEAFTPAGLIARISVDPPQPPRDLEPAISPELEEVLLRCLEKSPDERYESVGALAAALVPFASPRGVQIAERIARVLQAGSSNRVSSDPAPAPSARRPTPRTPPRSASRPSLASAEAAAQTLSQEAHTISSDGRPALAPAATAAPLAPAPARPRWLAPAALVLGLGGAAVFALSRPSPPSPAAAAPSAPVTAAMTPTASSEPAPVAGASAAPSATAAPPSSAAAPSPPPAARPAATDPRPRPLAASAAPGRPATPATPTAPVEPRPGGFATDFGDRK